MSVDLNDPNVAAAYEDIIRNKGTDWLLLSYGQTRDKLSLYASGQGDVLAFKEFLARDPDDVYFGFLRELENGKSHYALIAYVPETVSGVRRARALVHSRAVGSLLKAHNATINIAKLEQITTGTIRERLHLTTSLIPRATPIDRVQRTVSEPAEQHRPPSSVDSASGTHAPQLAKHASEASGMPSKSSSSYVGGGDTSMSRSLQTRHASQGWRNDMPPPTPPKDKDEATSLSFTRSISRAHPNETFSTKRAYSASQTELSYLSDGVDEETDRAVIRPGGRSVQASVNRYSTDSARAKSVPRPLSPEERQRMRMLARKQREEDELQAAHEESARMDRVRREKEKMLQDQEREERERLDRIRRDKEHALAEKARREEEHQREEARKAREMEEKRVREKERRTELARQLEEDRERSERRIQEAAWRKEEERQAAEVRRKTKIKDIQSRYADRIGTRPVLLEGSVTVQTSSSISWRRRYFELTASAMHFYRDSQDRGQVLDVIGLAGGRMKAVREPTEGYDELEAIPHSFAVEFSDDGPWSFYADSADDKDVLISLLIQVAGLRV